MACSGGRGRGGLSFHRKVESQKRLSYRREVVKVVVLNESVVLSVLSDFGGLFALL